MVRDWCKVVVVVVGWLVVVQTDMGKQFYINKGWYFVPIVCKKTEKEHGLCEDRGRE